MRYLIVLLAISILYSCTPDDSLEVPTSLESRNFVWKGLNLYYLWQTDVPDLSDNRFASQQELNAYLNNFSSPESLFQQLRTDAQTDRFSVIYSDYRVLQQVLSGTNDSNGMDFGLRFVPGSQTAIFGWVRYVLPGSDAAAKNVRRGDIFYAINGTPLTVSNYLDLLSLPSYTIELASFQNGILTPTGESVLLIKQPFAENPVHLSTVIQQGNKTIGYLMYNGFLAGWESQLNNAISSLKAAGINELVLDLRYNSGGSIATATRLASMITGQFAGQVFAREQWNSKAQAYFSSQGGENLIDRFTTQLGNGTPLTSLNLTRVFVLTTRSTASASELLINGLAPYIDVVQIGEATNGKNVGSITLYDSPDFRFENRNTSHRYAMQPIVLRIANSANFGEYTQGLPADILQAENLENLGTLGNPQEPLLQTALQVIGGNGRLQNISPTTEHFSDSKAVLGQNRMFRDLPPNDFN